MKKNITPEDVQLLIDKTKQGMRDKEKGFPTVDGKLREWVADKIEAIDILSKQPCVECADTILSHVTPIIKAEILDLFELKVLRCFHCNKESGTLVRLNPTTKVTKLVCMDCLWGRHPKTALEILEFILDKEQAATTGQLEEGEK